MGDPQISQKFDILKPEFVDAAVNAKYKGEFFSDRIWKNKAEMIDSLQNSLTEAMKGNITIDKVGRDIRDTFNVQAYESQRLVRTETARVATQASYDIGKNTGVEQVMWSATLDMKTAPEDAALDGKVWGINEDHPEPPLHPSCRCCLINVPYEGWSPTARKDNSTKEIIPYQTYAEWKNGKKIDGRNEYKPEPADNDMGIFGAMMNFAPQPVEEVKAAVKESTKTEMIKKMRDIQNTTIPKENIYQIEESETFRYTKSSNSKDINDYLRTGTMPRLVKQDWSPEQITRFADSLKPVVNALDNSMRPLGKNISVARYVDESYLKALGLNGKESIEIVREKIVGTAVTEKAYMSTSYNTIGNVFREYPVELNIKAKKGSMAYITGNDAEAEIILARNTSYIVSNVAIDEGRLFIYVDVL